MNLVGAANVTWCAVRHMGRGGRIVNVASRGAFRGEPDQPAYGASKAGLIAFGQSLARALGPAGIAVTAVAPGFTETDMAAEALAGEQGELRRAESPLGRVATPEDVAAAVLFLASPQAELASGTRARRQRSLPPAHVTGLSGSAQRLEVRREMAQRRRLAHDPHPAQLVGARRDGERDLDDVVDVALRVGPPRDRQAHELERAPAPRCRRGACRT